MESWQPSAHRAARPLDIVSHHKTQDHANQEYLVIVDREDIAREGVLVVRLDYHGAPDAIRKKTHDIREGLPSLSIGNTDWKDDILANATLPTYPRKSCAVLVDPQSRRHTRDIVERIDAGLQGRQCGTGTILAEWVGVETSDLSEMFENFGTMQIEWGWHSDFFIGVTHAAAQAGKVEVVSVGSRKSWQWPQETAGELFVWLAIGLVKDEEEVDRANGVLQLLLGV